MEQREEGFQARFYRLERQSKAESLGFRRKLKVVVWVGVAGIVAYFLVPFAALGSPFSTERSVLTNQAITHAKLVSSSDLLVNANGTATFRAQDITPTKFSDVFDVPYLSDKLGVPLLEWHELKHTSDSSTGGSPLVTEQLGCWSTSAGNDAWGGSRGQPTESYSARLYGLDISYTPVPSSSTLTHGADSRTTVWSIWALAMLGYPKTRAKALPDQLALTFPLHDGSGKKLLPDDHMLCFDLLYYTGVVQPIPTNDFFADYSPFWNQVGIHMRWKSSLVNIATQYLRRHFGVNARDPIPPFIAVHVRRADFRETCPSGINKDDCFAPMSAYHRRVQEVKERLRNRPNEVNVRAVLVTSDEHDAAWWDQVAALGPEWRWIDHKAEQTDEKYGNWFALLLDTVFQSMGAGFVGTARSTMSDIAQKRVEDWNGGETATVRWGTPGADDH
ncbi:O-FucT domain containing protein [Ceratobasidium theobromae]|uniref:O-FucT domain containing protein n=1 Tax=Ceratobasidium theobromae TaxID=1582974 RepID=A0A5N5QLQ4_9AGAM|nr:O-FucT domain containing protein [Ceratobasidium theobromae]